MLKSVSYDAVLNFFGKIIKQANKQTNKHATSLLCVSYMILCIWN